VKVHTFGVGSGASQELVKGVAEASKGTYSFCSESDNLKVKVIQALNRATQPCLEGAKVEGVSSLI